MIKYLIYYFEIFYSRIARKKVLKNEFDSRKAFYRRTRYYRGRRVINAEAFNQQLAEKIISGKPFVCGRFGSTELYATAVYHLLIPRKMKIASENLQLLSGFFSYDNSNETNFAELMKACMPNIDFLGIWNIPFEHYYVKSLARHCAMTYIRYLEPWTCNQPWTKELKGKTVLVIHPYADTISSQYRNREKLFANPDVLPDFRLITVKAVQTVAGSKDERFHNWFEALDWMYAKAMEQKFDVALIGCGAYGLPLAVKIKQAGKQAIHLGGVLQILFGIKGKRWDDDPVVNKLYNEYWVKPSEDEKPQNYIGVEGGCYW